MGWKYYIIQDRCGCGMVFIQHIPCNATTKGNYKWCSECDSPVPFILQEQRIKLEKAINNLDL